MCACSLCVWLCVCVCLRVKKLKETLLAVQQLDKNMCSLRSWLAHIETEISRPIVYDTWYAQEIKRKLNPPHVRTHTDRHTHTPQTHNNTQTHLHTRTHTHTHTHIHEV